MNEGNSVHLKGLNGIRALAALLVLYFHILLHNQGYFYLPDIHIPDLGGNAVTVFFSLSGFLITYLLIVEKERYHIISIKSFYLRRIFRIWPLYYLYFFLALIAILIFKFKISSSIYYYVFLTGNIPIILERSIPLIAHYWSIGVEEQFYLLWPLLFLFSIKNFGRRLLIFLSTFLILKIYFFTLGANGILYKTLLFTRFDCMIAGGIFAWYFYNYPLAFNILSHKLAQVAIWIIWILFTFNLIHIYAPLAPFFLSTITGLLMIMNIVTKKPILKIENPLADFFGKISFGIYIWHPLILIIVSRIIKKMTFPEYFKYLIAYIACPALVILIAYLSYTFYEKRFLKLKEKFSFVKSNP